MKKETLIRTIAIIIVILTIGMMLVALFCGCGFDTTARPIGTKDDINATQNVANKLVNNQPTPTDIEYSLERYNLIRRAYWVNGMREKAATLPCPIDKPLGYIVLFSGSGAVVGRFVVDGKVSSLNSYLTPDSEKYEQEYGTDGYSVGDGNDWLADVDGSYGSNVEGIFFFTPDGRYIEWTGDYLYSDIPFEVDDPILKTEGEE